MREFSQTPYCQYLFGPSNCAANPTGSGTFGMDGVCIKMVSTGVGDLN